MFGLFASIKNRHFEGETSEISVRLQKSNNAVLDEFLNGAQGINNAFWVIHQGFFHGKQRQPSPLVFI